MVDPEDLIFQLWAISYHGNAVTRNANPFHRFHLKYFRNHADNKLAAFQLHTGFLQILHSFFESLSL